MGCGPGGSWGTGRVRSAARPVVEELRSVAVSSPSRDLVVLFGGDLSAPHQFIRVSEAMAELGCDEEVLLWAKRGIAETDGWQVAQLYDLACGVYERRSAPLEILRLRREQHERMASASTYSRLRRAADAVGA